MQHQSDPLGGSNLAYVEQLYLQYLQDPSSVEAEWRSYFREVASADPATAEAAAVRRAVEGPSFEAPSIFHGRSSAAPARAAAPAAASGTADGGSRSFDATHWRQDRVNQLIHTYRVRGHLAAQIDPLGEPRKPVTDLELQHWGLGEQDLDAEFSTTGVAGANVLKLRDIVEVLQRAYCGSIGVQFMHIDDAPKKRWLIEHMEDVGRQRRLQRDEQLRILSRLTDAELLEQFIHKKFLGKKRFSLEGAETLIPLLDLAIEEAAAEGVQEVVFGMAHRGRLNVLVNIAGKPVSEVFYEFQDRNPAALEGGGDVKYHLGYSSDRVCAEGRKVHLSLCFNPSHLEFVNSVLVGRVRAKQDRFGDAERRQCLGIAIHGDAAFAGQGVTQELLNMSQLDGYQIGGLLHVIVNNQVGFTTSPREGRSTVYATEVARMIHTPIFHVNGEDPEAVAHVVSLAMAYRREFHTDVIIDMYCYRKFGHNEGDEPTFTQPLMYEVIRQRKTVREAYTEKLIALGGVSAEEAEAIRAKSQESLEVALAESQAEDFKARGLKVGDRFWRTFVGGNDHAVAEVDTGVEKSDLRALLEASVTTPDGFHVNPKLQKFIGDRLAMAGGEKRLDWGAAEILAYASLVRDGHRVRLSGQDSGRGTFTHRHSVFHDLKTGVEYVPLQHISGRQAPFEVLDSPLSEIGVLGFEYGYSLDTPEGLVLWEAQFGDFCNVAQVIIDQFIASSEAKWRRLSGLTLLLPHGFEGQGPEHSSARLERFLNLCAKDNIQVANPTTPAQIFHLLRRQVLRPLRKPLVVMTPKSMLRLPAATSTLDDLSQGRFQRVMADPASPPAAKVDKIVLTSGKLYYEIEAERQKRREAGAAGGDSVAILRLEQYYPLDHDALRRAFDAYRPGVPVVWAQEEPKNMGAWNFLHGIYDDREIFGRPFGCVSRPESASPAIGSESGHKQEQADLLELIFAWHPPTKPGGKRRTAVAV